MLHNNEISVTISRVPDGKIAREKVVNFYETFLWASVERGISTKSEIEDLLKCKDIMTVRKNTQNVTS